MDPRAALVRLGGIARPGELRALTSRRALRAAVERREVVRHGTAYALPDVDDARAAAARVGGTVSHLSAALHWGWKVKFPPERPTVTVRRSRCRVGEGVEVHWADLAADQVDGWVTTPLRTVVDCLRAYDDDVALSVADSALRGGMSKRALVDAARTSPRTGRSRAVELAEAADARAANPFESSLRSVTRKVPGLDAEPQQWVGAVGRADLVDHRLRLAIEAESHQFHSDAAALARDVRRYTGFAREGYVVARFTWEEVMFDPGHVRDALVDIVGHRGG